MKSERRSEKESFEVTAQHTKASPKEIRLNGIHIRGVFFYGEYSIQDQDFGIQNSNNCTSSEKIKRFSFPTGKEESMFDNKSLFYRMEVQLIAIQNLSSYNYSHAFVCTTMGLGILKGIKFIPQTLELSKFIFSYSARIYVRTLSFKSCSYT